MFIHEPQCTGVSRLTSARQRRSWCLPCGGSARSCLPRLGPGLREGRTVGDQGRGGAGLNLDHPRESPGTASPSQELPGAGVFLTPGVPAPSLPATPTCPALITPKVSPSSQLPGSGASTAPWSSPQDRTGHPGPTTAGGHSATHRFCWGWGWGALMLPRCWASTWPTLEDTHRHPPPLCEVGVQPGPGDVRSVQTELYARGPCSLVHAQPSVYSPSLRQEGWTASRVGAAPIILGAMMMPRVP